MSRAFLLLPAFLLTAPFALWASVDSDLLALVPSGASTVASIDVARAQSSAFGQHTLRQMDGDNNNNFGKFIEQTGFDPRRDLQNILLTSSAPAQGKNTFAVLARGMFDIDRIKSTARSKGSTVRSYHSWNLIVNKNGHDGNTALVFPQADIAIFGDLPTVEAILDNSTAASVLDAGLQRQINQVGSKNDAWFVSLTGAAMFGPVHADDGGSSAQSAQGKALQSILKSSGGILFGDKVEVSLDAVTRSPQDATSLADVVRLGASMVQMQRQKDARAAILASAIDNMALTASGEKVHLALSLEEKDLERLADFAHQPVSFDFH